MNIFQTRRMIKLGRPVRILDNDGEYWFADCTTELLFIVLFNAPKFLFSRRWEWQGFTDWFCDFPNKTARESIKKNSGIMNAMIMKETRALSHIYEQQYVCDPYVNKKKPMATFKERTGDVLSVLEKIELDNLDYELYLEYARLYRNRGLVFHECTFDRFKKFNKWRADDNIVFIINEYDKIVGISYWTYEKENEECMLHGICVDYRYRGNGFGRELLLHTLKSMEDRYPGRTVTLTVLPNNESACRLFDSVGFNTLVYQRMARIQGGKK